MSVLAGLIYAIYFFVLGYGATAALNLVKNTQLMIQSKTDFIAYAFFLGVVIHVLIFNAFQFFSFSPLTLLLLLAVILLILLSIIGQHLRTAEIKNRSFNPLNALPVTAVLLFSIFIYWNGSLLPNIAWDSWSVWEGKSQQWILHGLSTTIDQWDHWLQNNHSIFNQSSNYPDGLSLIYYLPELLLSDGFNAVYVVTLIAFGMMALLLVSKLAQMGASWWLQTFIILVLYTTPFINNHLMIQGYADLWIGMYVLLIMLSLIDYFDDKQFSNWLITACCLIMLPMLKLEGWVWISLFLMAYIGVKLFHTKQAKWILLAAIATVVIVFLLGGINLSLPMGDLIINHERISLFNFFDTQLKFVNITDQLWTSFFWQNNWSLLWLGLPFVLFSFVNKAHNQAIHMVNVFFVLALLCLMFLFYFTEASQWAIDFTAINRVVLQLTPGYIFLLARLIVKLNGQHVAIKNQPAVS